jgi:O-antigen ligase
VNEKFGTLRLTNAHNEWLTILVNQGIVGIVGFAGIICSAVYRYIKDRKVCIAPAVCGIGILAYTINNIFSFQTSMNVPTMFVLLGIGEAYMRAGEKQKE